MGWLRVTDPRGRTRWVRVGVGRTYVGRSGACEVQLDDPEVAPCQASLTMTPRGLLLLDETGGRAIVHNGVRTDHLFVGEGGEFWLGQSHVAYSERGPGRESVGPYCPVVMTSSRTLLGTPDAKTLSQPLPPKQASRATGPAAAPTLPGIARQSRKD